MFIVVWWDWVNLSYALAVHVVGSFVRLRQVCGDFGFDEI